MKPTGAVPATGATATGDEGAAQTLVSEPGRLAGFEPLAVAGTGGMAVVYRAREPALGRVVALKVIAPEFARDAGFRARFEREWRLAAALEHPNVLPVYGAGEDDGRLWLSMRFVDGSDLATVIERRGPLPAAEAVELVAQVASALDAAHERGLVHRDVKPGNILIGDRKAYLTDFGVAIGGDGDTRLTTTGRVIGTVAYLAPEQIRGGRVDARADIYALGGVLYTCLTGRLPFPADNNLDALAAHLGSPPPRPTQAAAGVPAGFDRVVAWAMAKSPDDRPPSAGRLAQAAREAAGAGTLSGVPRVRSPRRTRRATRLAALTAVAIAVATAGVVILVAREPSPSDHAGRRAAVIGPRLQLVNEPDRVAVADGAVWTMTQNVGRLERTDPRTGRTRTHLAAVDLGGGNFPDMAAGAGGLWTTQSSVPSGGVTKVDARTGEALGRAQLAGAHAVATAPGAVWATAIRGGGGRIVRLDPRGVRVVAGPASAGRSPVDVAADGAVVLVAERSGDAVLVLDARSLHPLRRIAVGRGPAVIAARGPIAWVANLGDRTLQRLDPARGEAVGPVVSLGKELDDIVLAPHALWVAAADGTVTRLDAETGAVAQPPVNAGAAPLHLTADGARVWAASETDRTVLEVRAS